MRAHLSIGLILWNSFLPTVPIGKMKRFIVNLAALGMFRMIRFPYVEHSFASKNHTPITVCNVVSFHTSIL